MFQDTSEGDAFLEQTENSTLRDDDTAQTLSFEITHDNTSLSPSQSAANEDLLSSSAPMYIPVKNGLFAFNRFWLPLEDNNYFKACFIF